MNNFPKIWGTNSEIFSNDLCSVNVLRVKKGGTCSYHNHTSKHNIFYVLSGKLSIRTEHGDTIIEPNQVFTVYAGTKHKFVGLEDTTAIEVMFVQYDSNDIQRDDVGFIDKKIAEGEEL